MIGPAPTRVYLAVLDLYRSTGRAVIPDICTATGLASKATVHRHLVNLRRAGLLTWDDGRVATIRPLVFPVGLLAVAT